MGGDVDGDKRFVWRLWEQGSAAGSQVLRSCARSQFALPPTIPLPLPLFFLFPSADVQPAVHARRLQVRCTRPRSGPAQPRLTTPLLAHACIHAYMHAPSMRACAVSYCHVCRAGSPRRSPGAPASSPPCATPWTACSPPTSSPSRRATACHGATAPRAPRAPRAAVGIRGESSAAAPQVSDLPFLAQVAARTYMNSGPPRHRPGPAAKTETKKARRGH